MRILETSISMLNNINVGVTLICPKLEIVWVNKVIKEWFPWFDFRMKSLCSCYSYMFPGDACHHKLIEGVFKTGKIRQTKTEMFVNDQAYKVTFTPLKEGGKIAYVVETVEEITCEKKAEDRLKQLVNALERSPSAVVITDINGSIEYVNPKFSAITGYSPVEVLGKTPRILKSGKTPPEVYNQLWAAIRAGNEWQGEFCNKKKNGDYYWELTSISPVRNSLGVITNFIAVKEDITKLKRTMDEKNEIQAKYMQAQKMEAIGLLAGGVAHDFNNMLTTILGFTSMAMMNVGSESDAYKNMIMVNRSAVRAAGIARQLLLFSRKQPEEFACINLNNTIDNLNRMLGRLIGEDIDIEAKFEPGLYLIMADEGNLEQVLTNLAVNARDAMPGGGKILIKTENIYVDAEYCKSRPYAKRGKHVCLSVIDAGSGMDKETINHIFEPFFSTKEACKGTGLGLSVVYGVIKRHNGWIEVNSELGRGSRFEIYLPASDSAALEKTAGAMFPEANHGHNERVLLVEDDDDTRGLVKKALKECGYDVFEAANAKDAESIFKRENRDFQLVFSDVVLPDKSGLRLVEDMIGQKSGLKILLTSGYNDDKSQWPAIQKKGFRFLQKPFSLFDLLQAVNKAINDNARKLSSNKPVSSSN